METSAKMAAAGIAALVLGFVGGLAGSALHPGQTGKPGAAGRQGIAGPPGAQGPTGTATLPRLNTQCMLMGLSDNEMNNAARVIVPSDDGVQGDTAVTWLHSICDTKPW